MAPSSTVSDSPSCIATKSFHSMPPRPRPRPRPLPLPRPHSRHTTTTCYMNYKFGDISKSIGKKITSAINKQTGKDEYEFGDLTKWLDQKAKARASAITGKEDYEFGDLSKWVDMKVKEKANEFSGKSDYDFGDVIKEIVRRAISGEYEMNDIITLCKILLSFGVGLSPVTKFFPSKFLIDFINYSIVEDVSQKLIGGLTQELDRRVKRAITGDEKYQLGDFTKAQILKYINKDEYTFGDITKKILSDADAESNNKETNVPKTFLSNSSLELEPEILLELEKWDKAMMLNTTMSQDP